MPIVLFRMTLLVIPLKALQFMFRPRIRNKQKGVTVLELVIGSAILSTVLMALLSLVIGGVQVVAAAEQQAKAHGVARELLESLRNYRDAVPWDQDDGANEYDGLGVI